jgi:hypothetical protein
MIYTYDIKHFTWIKELNLFVGIADDLTATLTDGSLHPISFPSYTTQFYIMNYKSKNQRRFRFINSEISYIFHSTTLIFVSDDSIVCRVVLNF